MNFGAIFKLLGIKIAPEHLAQIEEIIPHIPRLAQHCIGRFNGYDDRLRKLEHDQIAMLQLQREILEKLNAGTNSDNSDPISLGAGTGSTELAYARGDGLFDG